MHYYKSNALYRSVFLNPGPGDPKECTSDSTNQRFDDELNQLCSAKAKTKMCTLLGPQDHDIENRVPFGMQQLSICIVW